MRVEEIDSQLAPLKKEYGDLQRRAAPILDRINDLERDIRETERDARSTKDDRRKRDLQRDADRLRSRQREEERRLDPIQRDMTRVKKEAAVFETQRAHVAAAFQAVALQINQNLALLAKAEKEIERSERQLLEPAKPTPKQLAMTNKMSALTTWLPFPLEEERDRLLSGK
jgi:chromosome segregation ATPase